MANPNESTLDRSGIEEELGKLRSEVEDLRGKISDAQTAISEAKDCVNAASDLAGSIDSLIDAIENETGTLYENIFAAFIEGVDYGQKNPGEEKEHG